MSICECGKEVLFYPNFYIIIFLYRFLDLTEEEKEKLRGSYKVAKKLDKLENMGQDR